MDLDKYTILEKYYVVNVVKSCKITIHTSKTKRHKLATNYAYDNSL